MPIIAIGYFAVGNRYKNYLLLFASLFFYAWGEPLYVLLMLVSIIFNYGVGVFIESACGSAMQRLGITVGIVVNIGLLGLFKYLNLAAETVNLFFGLGLSLPQIILPIGISFYTFQAMSYIIDVYRGKTSCYTRGVRAQHSFADLALYISFFPQLIAGPIVNYKTIEHQLIAYGIKRFLYGLSKKVLISNTLALCADKIFALSHSEINSAVAWLAVLCYTFQIYYDFSGYSDMAIGLGKIFGFSFLENFNYPYVASSIQDFWRRWHISLSSWFREYLYIPLGGNRGGLFATYRNLFIVFFITGLWHGASWSFVVWGLWHGCFMVIERLFLGKLLSKNRLRLINHIYTLLVVIIGWVFFRAENLSTAAVFLQNMFIPNLNNTITATLYIDIEVVVTLAVAVLLCGPVQQLAPVKSALFNKKVFTAEMIYLPFLLILSIIQLVSGEYNPFIYFQF